MYANVDANTASETGRWQQQAPNNGDVFKALSIFVHRFNLLFLFWFINCCIRRVLRLCYCCCPLAVCLDQLWLILPREDWTLQMSAYNLLIPFISGCWCLCVCVSARARVCVRVCLSKTDGGGWMCLCWKWVDLIYTGLFTQQGREGASCVGCLSVSFLVLSLCFSHMLVSFCRYSSRSHTLPISSHATYIYIITFCFSLTIFGCLPIHSQFLSLAAFYYFVYFYFTSIHSESVLISYSLTLPPCTYSGSISTVYQVVLIQTHTYQSNEM